MNPFDESILHFLNAFSQHSQLFDLVVVRLSDLNLLKGGVMMALFWGGWARKDDEQREHREILLIGLFTAVLATFLARVLAFALPFRARPLQNPLLGFHIPYSMDPSPLINWSSFPSDHATLFFSLAMTLWMVSKRFGALAFCHAFFVVSLPRIYLGIHYPTDVIAGALLGIGVASLAKWVWLRRSVAGPILGWMDHYPSLAYAFLFLWSYEIAELFDSVRHIANRVLDLFLTVHP